MTISTTARRRAWLCLAVGAALLSVVFARAQEPKRASAGDDAKAREEVERAAAETRPANINVNPFIGLAEQGRMLVETGRIGADTTLDMTATAELREDGTLKPESVKIEWRAVADEEVAQLARRLLTAISQSKILAVLKDSTRTVRLTARLDRDNLAFGLKSEFASEAQAMQWATGYGMMITVARKTKGGTDAGRFYEAVRVASEGKAIEVTFEMPKVFAAKMVAEMMDKRAAGRP